MRRRTAILLKNGQRRKKRETTKIKKTKKTLKENGKLGVRKEEEIRWNPKNDQRAYLFQL